MYQQQSGQAGTPDESAQIDVACVDRRPKPRRVGLRTHVPAYDISLAQIDPFYKPTVPWGKLIRIEGSVYIFKIYLRNILRSSGRSVI